MRFSLTGSNAIPLDEKNKAALLFGGDFCPVRRYEEKILAGAPVFDAALKSVFAESDFSVVNLEATLCPKGTKSASPTGYGLRSAPEVAAFMKEMNISAAGLANNHIRDFGDDGVSRTLDALDKAGVLRFGAGRNAKEAERPLVIERNGLRIGLWALAEKELNLATGDKPGAARFNPETNVLRIEEFRHQFDFLAIFLHAGHEFMATPSPRIREACRAFVNAGADAVIAHHPHVPQGAERYKGALIVYSLGNLAFDSDYVSSYENADIGYMVKAQVGRHTVEKVEIVPYRLEKDAFVRPLSPEALDAFREMLARLSANITDDTTFNAEWRRNVAARWERDYKNILRGFSRRFSDPGDLAFPRWAKNFFACPTHEELLETAFDMLAENILGRD